jgi:hypothetical protein
VEPARRLGETVEREQTSIGRESLPREFTSSAGVRSPASGMTNTVSLLQKVNSFPSADQSVRKIALTIGDPKVYIRPWTVTLRQRMALDTELVDYHCNDNEKSAPHMVGR